MVMAMHRWVKVAVVATSFALMGTILGAPSNAADSDECKFGSQVYGIGARSQAFIQYRLLVKQFHAERARGGCRSDVQGLINFSPATEEKVLTTARDRETDVLGNRYIFYGIDRPLSSAEKNLIETQAETLRPNLGSVIVHIPLWIEGVAVAYNLDCPGAENLRLGPTALSAIFSGQATAWNDPAILGDNPDTAVQLQDCNKTIRVAVRSDANGQTLLFKDYLSKRDPQWNAYKQTAANTLWPPLLLDPCRGRGDEGEAACVAGQPGSIGYVGFATAFRLGLKTAAVQNKTSAQDEENYLGYVLPSYEACTAAASLPTAGYPPDASGDWSTTSITDPAQGYPICGLQFAFAFRVMSFSYIGRNVSVEMVRTVKDYLKWAVIPVTQRQLPQYGAAPLPENLRQVAQAGAESLRYGTQE